MILAFVMLFAGGMLLGGAWSFHRAGRPWWLRILMLVLALVCIAVCIWRIQT